MPCEDIKILADTVGPGRVGPKITATKVMEKHGYDGVAV